METEGDLREMAAATVALEEAWASEARKFRTPHDWLLAVLRAVEGSDAAAGLVPLLAQLRQPLWAPPSPKGYGDALRDWADPDALIALTRAVTDGLMVQRVMTGLDLGPVHQALWTHVLEPLKRTPEES